MSLGKVLIIDDSKFVQNYLSQVITSISGLQLLDAISDGQSGVQKIFELYPDVIILDLEMANGDGLFVLQQIEEKMSFAQRPFVLIYSSRAQYTDPVFKKAIEFGFCDFVLKTTGNIETLLPKIKSVFISKILAGIEARKMRNLLNKDQSIQSLNTGSVDKNSVISNKSVESELYPVPSKLESLPNILNKKYFKPKLLLIGASTGGPQVIRDILSYIDNEISIPIAIVQHMPEKFTTSFALELMSSSSLPVYELKHNMPLEKGKAYVFPGGVHGKLSSFGNLLVYYKDRTEYEKHPFKPSVDLTIESLQPSFLNSTVGVILSGMGKDGASGMKKMHDNGSLIFAQDKYSSAVWGMPGEAVRNGAADIVLSQEELGKGIVTALTYLGVHPRIGGING